MLVIAKIFGQISRGPIDLFFRVESLPFLIFSSMVFAFSFQFQYATFYIHGAQLFGFVPSTNFGIYPSQVYVPPGVGLWPS